ncbi:MAG: hypothetical protein QOD57_4106 [Actinomycetota bacterium]|nr:hypothetical protein [Actinomycetota bacterium]
MADAADHYEAATVRIAGIVRNLDDRQLATPVPACPGWTVRDLVCHLTGVAKDVTANNMAGAPGRAWTDAQVNTRTDVPLAGVLEEWEALVPVVRRFMGEAPALMGSILVSDVTAHEHDLLAAVGRTGDRDGGTVHFAFEGLVGRVGTKLTEAGKPALRVVAGDRELVAGDGEPAATVTCSPFEFIRAFTGRRSPDQLRALFTAGDPEVFVGSMSVFEPRPDPLVE